MAKKSGEIEIRIYFSQLFRIDPQKLEDYGALDISLVNDLPLFIDPFLLFNSEDLRYKTLHEEIIKYISFLRDEAQSGDLEKSLILDWFTFSEVKQNWLGFRKTGNGGRGLGWEFARSLHSNLHNVFKDFGIDKGARGTHIEKLCLIKDGVGRDNVSDFTTNLIKEYLCIYTQDFAISHLHPSQRKKCSVPKSKFNFTTKTWMSGQFNLPYVNGDYVLLTPKNILTKDNSWINRDELIEKFPDLVDSVPNHVLKSHLARYLRERLDARSKKNERETAYSEAIERYPEILEYYIKLKEDGGAEAAHLSRERVLEALQMFVVQVKKFATNLYQNSDFYETSFDSLDAARKRALFMKDVIENNDGYRIFYLDGRAIQREEDLQILYRLTWYATVWDVNREVNNGRGPVDFKISKGSSDKSLVEMKLASNSKLKQNLRKQVSIYSAANKTNKTIKVILSFNETQKRKCERILRELGFAGNKDFILIDADRTNKKSASTER